MPDYEMLRYDEMFFEAESLIEKRQVAQAVNLLETIIEEQPDYGKAHNHLAWLYEHEYKDFQKSERHYQAAIGFTPTYPSAYINYCHLLSRLGELEKLENILQKAANISGIKRSDLFNEYGILHEMRGDYLKAASFYKDAILHSLINSDIENYQGALQRCLLKLELTDTSEQDTEA